MRRGGFTLVELLVVVAILGIVAAVAAPHVGAALSGGRLRVAARELAGAGRHARTMALLHQTPVDLVADLGASRISVIARERDSASWLGLSDLAAVTNDTGYTDELLRTSARRASSLSGGFGLAVSRADAEAGVATNLFERLAQESGEAGVDTPADVVSIADVANFTRELAGVKIRFGGWRDSSRSRRAPADEMSGGAMDGGEAAVRYRANGTVRPHRWVVEDADHSDDRLVIDVNAVGRVRVRTAEEAGR